jgi:AraC-like DNA-binding protein
MDPLSDVLTLLKPRSSIFGGLDIGAPYAIEYPPHEGIKCYALASGSCWLVMQGLAEPLRMEAGDCFVLPRGLPFVMTTDLALKPLPFAEVVRSLPPRGQGGMATLNGGGSCMLMGAFFQLHGVHAHVLLSVLPPVVHLRSDEDKAALRWAMERLGCELRQPRPGSALMAQQLATMLLVQALRLHLAEGARGGTGWLCALADRQIGGAMEAMHSEPARAWTLQLLAAQVGMSRSSFAERFKQIVGATPMEYLTRWRMLLAADRIEGREETVAAIASSLGYESESAFAKAFKRVMGCSPRRYGRAEAARATHAEAHDAVAAAS